MDLSLIVFKETYAICKLDSDCAIPLWVSESDFYSATRTTDELSIICKQSIIKDSNIDVNKDWSVLKIIGPLDFSLTGIIADVSNILKNQNIPIFTISTFETDYILVKNSNLNKTIEALAHEHVVISDE